MLALALNTEIVAVPDVSDMVDAWRKSLDLRVGAGELSSTSAVTYRAGVRRFVAWCKSSTASGVSADLVRDWKRSLLDAGSKPGSVNTWLSGVRDLFSWAVERGILAHNPVKSVKGASRKGVSKKHGRDMLTDSEVRRVMNAVDIASDLGKRDLAIIALMVYAGLREVEIVRADLANYRDMGGRKVLDIQGKGHSEADNYIVISAKVEDILAAWLSVRGNKPGALFVSLSDRCYFDRLSTRSIRGLVKSYFKYAMVIGNKTTHSLRHTAITKAVVKRGVVDAKSFARHENIETTMIYYHEVERLARPVEDEIEY